MNKNILLTCFAVLLICSTGSLGLDRRLNQALQNANIDFLSFEGNRKPAVVPPINPIQTNIDGPKVTPTSTTTSTAPSTTKPTTPASGVKLLINKFNAGATDGERQVPVIRPNNGPSTNINRQSSVGINSNTNQNPNSGPTISTNPIRQQPSVPTREEFFGLPKKGDPAVAPPAATPKPISWSSVVAGNSKPGGPPSPGKLPSTVAPAPGPGSSRAPSNISPGNVPKSAQSLRPISLGEDRDRTGPVQPAAGAAVAAANELVSDAELKDLSEAMFRKDTNNAAKYITVNYQGKTSSFSKTDLAPQPLLTVQPAAWSIPTIAAMKVLLDNYEQDTTVNEHITPQEKNEENEFLDAIMATSVIRHLMTFLKEKGLVSPDPRQQKDVLKQMWFNMYSRGMGKIGSSGFEHIFVSEIKNGEVSGLHNWIYFQGEEAANRANYLGYLKKVDLADKGAILKLHFSLKGIDKPVDTMFVGTSPELEVGLYSLCFLTRMDRACPLSLANQAFNLRTHNFRYRSKNMIGSAFPEI